MKTAIVVVSVALLQGGAYGQYVVERGPHHNILEYVESEQRDGRTQTRTSQVTELGTGLNYWDADQNAWVPSSNEIEFVNSRAVYRKGQFKLIFASNINDPDGNLEWFPAANERIVIQTFGIAMREVATGNSVFIAQSKDTQGFLTAPNEVTYPSCFDNINADVRISINPGGSGFQNDIILRERVPDPATYGFRGECRIEAWHEIIAGPQPELHHGGVNRAGGRIDADAQFRLGNMTIGQGTAFLIGAPADQAPGAAKVPAVVGKQYFIDPETQQRFLVESVPISEVEPHLQQLPEREGAWKVDKSTRDRLEASWRDRFDKRSSRPVALRDRLPRGERLVAAISRKEIPEKRGLLLDFSTLLANHSNYTLRGDTTYLVNTNTTVNLNGTTVIEPGCVIKFDGYNSANGTPVILINGPLDCQTVPYAPCVLTARDDYTLGETNTALRTNVMAIPYGAYHLKFPSSNTNAIQLHNIRSRFAQNGFGFLGTNTVQAWNIQVYGTYSNVFEGAGNNITLRNVLVHNANAVAVPTANNTAFKGEHFTIHSASKTYSAASFTGCSFHLTNSLLVVVTNSSSSGLTTVSTDSIASDAGIFQTVGAGAHYLASNTYRNSGSTNISTNLTKGVFRYSTTYAPIVLGNSFNVNTTLAPQAHRDVDVPDRGYHYPTLDWVIGSASLGSGVTLLLTNGVALGYHSTSGITMSSGSAFISEGRPLNLNRIVRYNTVQEQPIQWGTIGVPMRFLDIPNEVPTVSLRLTEVAHLAYAPGSSRNNGISDTSAVGPTTVTLRDCELYSTSVDLSEWGHSFPSATFKNNMLHRSFVYVTDDGDVEYTVNVYNNLFCGGQLTLNYTSVGDWTVLNNLFDNATISLGGATPANGNNGYLGTSAMTGGSGNVTVASRDYQNGVQGRWYYPTSGGNLSTLINAGSMTAVTAQLFHYTTRTDHAKDTSTVDIGYHYISIDANGATDFDGDGIPDYLEDKDGDGVADASETSWQSYTSPNGISGNPGLQVFTPLQ